MAIERADMGLLGLYATSWRRSLESSRQIGHPFQPPCAYSEFVAVPSAAQSRGGVLGSYLSAIGPPYLNSSSNAKGPWNEFSFWIQHWESCSKMYDYSNALFVARAVCPSKRRLSISAAIMFNYLIVRIGYIWNRYSLSPNREY